MKKKSKHLFHHLSFKMKILTLILCGFGIILLAGIMFMTILSRAYENRLYRSAAVSLSYSSSNLSDQLENMDNIVDSLLANNTIQESLDGLLTTPIKSEQQDYQNRIYAELNNYLPVFNQEAVQSISILQNDYLITTASSHLAEIPQEIQEDLITLAEKQGGATSICTSYSTTYGLFLIKQLRKIEALSLEPLGTLIINLDPASLIAASTTTEYVSKDSFYCLFDEEHLIYLPENFSRNDVQQLDQQVIHSYDIISLASERVFTVRGHIPKYNWTILSGISYSSLYQTISLSMGLFIFLIAVVVGIVSLICIRTILALFRQFDHLIDIMKQFGAGHYEISDHPIEYSADEIGLLYHTFDDMVNKIETLIEQNYVNELLKKEAQIKAMESQMDPHFLYNTLDSINWRAKLIHSEEISQITTALGALLRTSLKNTSLDFSLEQELGIVENYITIQKIRYQDRLDFTIDIPDMLLELPIPKFTLQPLLENAIRYGLEESSDTCYISVIGRYSEEQTILRVMNTESSFEDDIMEKLLNDEICPHGFGIGLRNIHKRIQLMYGSEYGLSLYNIEDEETYEECAVAEIRLPGKARK